MINLVSESWEINNIETVLFDKDGTFIDLHFFWGKMTEMRTQEVIKTYKLDEDLFSILCGFLGYDYVNQKMLSDGITALYSRVKIIEIFNDRLQKFGVNATKEELTKIFDNVSCEFYKEIDLYTKPIQEAIEFIKKIRSSGAKIGIVTSDSVESTKLTLKNFGWENLFDTVIGRESSQETKESGVPTRMALDILKADPKKTIMIGDAPMDYISAKNAGVDKTVLVASGQVSFDELMKLSPYTLKSLKEVKCLKS